ncbi:hypothetical protein IVB36_26480 [Bradyrhizobium sp. 35]|uniref:hypothetical protein n=1 Tax=unclassified Bradyrhizobium TaxID=2631580 RepID=UPI0012FA355E|nr:MULTISPECIES: hypothetical protein [unclassified Bradyrhizobium]MCK1454321.1 hypothetical protein [Bradyrhizobium sp. 35]
MWDILLDIGQLGISDGEDRLLNATASLPGAHGRRSAEPAGAPAMLSPSVSSTSTGKRSLAIASCCRKPSRDAEWVDLGTVVLSSSYGRDMATTPGYAHTVRLWRRGTGADQAPVIFDIAAGNGRAPCNVDHTVAQARMWFVDQVRASGGLCSAELHHHRRRHIGDT